MKVTHRQVGTTGTLWGVEFVDGVGYTDDPVALDKLRRQGHKIEPDWDEQTEPDDVYERAAQRLALDDIQEPPVIEE